MKIQIKFEFLNMQYDWIWTIYRKPIKIQEAWIDNMSIKPMKSDCTF